MQQTWRVDSGVIGEDDEVAAVSGYPAEADHDPESTANRGHMPAGPRPLRPAAAFLVAVLGAAAIMVSPITAWMAAWRSAARWGP